LTEVEMFRALHEEWVSKVCAIGFVLLIVVPVTAPFQTFSVVELSGRLHTAPCLDGNVALVAFPRDAAVSTASASGAHSVRSKLESHSDSERRSGAYRPLEFSSPSSTPPAGPADQQRAAVLRV